MAERATSIMKGNWHYALLAFALALVSWYFVSGREKVDIWMRASLQFTNMPENYVIREGMLREINVRVRGPKGLIRGQKEKTLVYSLNLSGLKPGPNVLPIRPDRFPLSKSFEIMEINPPRVEVVVDRLAQRRMPVRPLWEGTLDPDYQLVEVRVRPQEVTVQGPEKILTELREIDTQVIALPSATPGIIEEVAPLSLPAEVETDNGFVDVRLVFAVKRRPFTFTLPVELVNHTSFDAGTAPSEVEVVVEVPLPLTRQGEVRDLLSVRVVAESYFGPGARPVSPELTMPSGSKLVSISPSLIELTLSE